MVSDRRLSRARLASALLGTAAAVGALVAYPTSTGHSPRPAALVAGAPPSASSAPSTTSAASGSSTTVTGDVVDTQWGPVQVEITVSGGRIIAARAVQQPNGNAHDAEINGFALPVLAQEAVQANSAAIDSVSGATVTSQGYIGSLQSALDSAHLP